LYRNVPRRALPCGESLGEVAARVQPFWDDQVAPCILAHRQVLVVAHDGPLRALCRYLEGSTEDEVLRHSIPSGMLMVYELDGNMRFCSQTALIRPDLAASPNAPLGACISSSPVRYILCTGGLGYIGSHTVVQLLNQGYKVAILDNLMNSNPRVLERIRHITSVVVPLFVVDMLDRSALKDLFVRERFHAVIHFAGLKAVGESVAKPLWYYENNLVGTLNLLNAMQESDCRALVFSSSATVYLPCEAPLDEEKPLGCSNPYGWTKFMIERVLMDAAHANKELGISILRYFNPVGAHSSGLIGESPSSYPNNLMPFIQQVAVGRRECLSIFGTDYDTPDGTGVRDYIHVEDLAAGHLSALRKVFELGSCCLVHNLGSGIGVSVKDMVRGFERASGRPIPVKEVGRRPGDLASVVANAAKAKQEFGWETSRGVDEMCASAWNWVSANPFGYEDAPARSFI